MSIQYVAAFRGKTDAEIVGLSLPKLEAFISNLQNGYVGTCVLPLLTRYVHRDSITIYLKHVQISSELILYWRSHSGIDDVRQQRGKSLYDSICKRNFSVRFPTRQDLYKQIYVWSLSCTFDSVC